jgi:transposase
MLIQKCSVKDLEKKFKSENNSNVKTRIHIILYLKDGKTQREVSAELRISIGIVPYWKKRFEKEGFEGLIDKKGRGRKAKLKETQINLLALEVEKGILMNDGYRRGYITKDIRMFIKEKFGITYSMVHCRRLMHLIKFNLKVPRPRNKSRNQKAVDEFKESFKKNLKVWIKER